MNLRFSFFSFIVNLGGLRRFAFAMRAWAQAQDIDQNSFAYITFSVLAFNKTFTFLKTRFVRFHFIVLFVDLRSLFNGFICSQMQFTFYPSERPEVIAKWLLNFANLPLSLSSYLWFVKEEKLFQHRPDARANAKNVQRAKQRIPTMKFFRWGIFAFVAKFKWK